MKNIVIEDLELLGKYFLQDTDIEFRSKSHRFNHAASTNICEVLLKYDENTKLVYTAFDGDHFHFLTEMRKAVISDRKYPAHPESILGYKNVVSKYKNKLDILYDDISILQHCDELWIFTDVSPSLEKMIYIPEGILVELTFFMKWKPDCKIVFVSLRNLLVSGKIEKKYIKFTYDALAKTLYESEREEIIHIVTSESLSNRLRNICGYISDPLDLKYAEWLRDHKNNEFDEVPLVPGLSISISDAEFGLANIGSIIVSWGALLSRLCSKIYVLDKVNPQFNKSYLAEGLRRYSSLKNGRSRIYRRSWNEFDIPKCEQKENWPITRFESKILKKDEKSIFGEMSVKDHSCMAFALPKHFNQFED